MDLKQNRRHQIPSLSACRMLAAAVLEPSVPTHLSVLTTASTSGMLALWEIALSSLSSWLFNRRYLFLKQDNWGAGEKNVMNPSEWQANMQFYGMQCHRPLRAAEQGTQFSPLHLSQPFTLPASTTAHSHSKPTSCCFLRVPHSFQHQAALRCLFCAVHHQMESFPNFCFQMAFENLSNSLMDFCSHK